MGTKSLFPKCSQDKQELTASLLTISLLNSLTWPRFPSEEHAVCCFPYAFLSQPQTDPVSTSIYESAGKAFGLSGPSLHQVMFTLLQLYYYKKKCKYRLHLDLVYMWKYREIITH